MPVKSFFRIKNEGIEVWRERRSPPRPEQPLGVSRDQLSRTESRASSIISLKED